MKKTEKEKTRYARDKRHPVQLRQTILKGLYPLPGKETLERILELDNPRQLIQELPGEDFFWLIKKVGDDDCLPVLGLASEEQWEYMLDLELWRKDRLDLNETFRWLGRLHQADSRRLARWLFDKGLALAYCFFLKKIQVEIKEEEEVFDPGEDFVTFDGLFYIRVLDKEQRETVENLLLAMANEDHTKYHSILLGLAGVLPVETEEMMYRLRSIRLAEHGFLPFEEAISAYAPLDPQSLQIEKPLGTLNGFFDDKTRDLAPVSPLYYAGGHNILTQAFSGINDDFFLDRIRLEFAGLCNQILSADGLFVSELDVLIKISRKAAGYLNLAIEKKCGKDVMSAGQLLKTNSLVSVFRVGFGLALALKWEAEQWVKRSWFNGQGFGFSFWGDELGQTLAGIMESKPRFFSRIKEREEFRDFERLSELDSCRRLVKRLMVLDKLLENLTEIFPLNKQVKQDDNLAFRPLLFNLWARQLLEFKPCFSSISLEQAKIFFSLLRGGSKKPPYQMTGFEKIFIRDFMAYSSGLESEAETVLEDALSLIWQDFCEEYELISVNDLDPRFTKYIQLRPSP